MRVGIIDLPLIINISSINMRRMPKTTAKTTIIVMIIRVFLVINIHIIVICIEDYVDMICEVKYGCECTKSKDLKKEYSQQ